MKLAPLDISSYRIFLFRTSRLFLSSYYYDKEIAIKVLDLKTIDLLR